MELNINEIASEKINKMLESGEIRQRIENDIEQSIFRAIDSACSDYSFRSAIEKHISSVLGDVAAGVNLGAYKNFLISRINNAISDYVKADTVDKIEADFRRIYLDVPKNMKLSQIIEKYKEWLIKELDEDDRQRWGKFDISFKREYLGWIDIELKKPGSSRYEELQNFCFTIHYKDISNKDIGYISAAKIAHNDLKKEIGFGNISSFEAMIFNLMYTKAEIEIDLEDAEDVDAYLYDDDY